MQILIVHNRYQEYGGEDRVVEQEQRLLADNGHDVNLFSVSNDRIQGIGDRLMVGLNLAYSNEWKMRLARNLEEVRPDIVHAHNFFPLLTPSIYDACIEAELPVVQTLHNYRIACANGLFLRNGEVCEKCIDGSPYNAVRYKCYRGSRLGSLAVSRMIAFHRKHGTWSCKINKIIALSEFSRKKFIQAGVPPNRIAVKPNFVDMRIDSGGATAKESAGLYVGRLSREKGLETLLDAWDGLSGRLTVIGDGPLAGLLDGHVGRSVEWRGLQDHEDVLEAMRRFLFLVVPSRCYENFPVSIVEAYSCELPVIASGMGAMAEIVEDGVTGLHYRPGDYRDLRSKINWAFNNPEKMKVMGVAAFEKFKKHYSASENYKQLMEIYEDALVNR